MTTQNIAKIVESELKALLKLLQVTPQSIKVEPQEDDTVNIQLDLPAAESGILIGYHAETLASLQYILSLILHQKTGDWRRLILNINNYRQNREETLKDMAHNAADRARLTGQEVAMPYLASFERRLIHLNLAEEKDIETVSVGEGRDRRLIIRL